MSGPVVDPGGGGAPGVGAGADPALRAPSTPPLEAAPKAPGTARPRVSARDERALQAGAAAEAAVDGRPDFASLGRGDRERYIMRFELGLEAYMAELKRVIEESPRK